MCIIACDFDDTIAYRTDDNVPRQLLPNVKEVINWLYENHTIIISSHILSDVEKVMDHAIIMHKGTILRDCSFDNLREEFIRFTLISLTGQLPAELPFENAISCEKSGSRAIITVQNDSQENLEAKAKALNCEIEIRPLSLDEIYRIVVS